MRRISPHHSSRTILCITPKAYGHAFRLGAVAHPALGRESEAEVEGHGRMSGAVAQPTDDDSSDEEANIEGHAARGKA